MFYILNIAGIWLYTYKAPKFLFIVKYFAANNDY